MHLSAIKLRGFKSFPDPVEIRLEPGVAVVVGPNGSGKSNVSDGIVWAAGSLAPSELRAEKPDDVLFAGAAGRKATDFCEVELLFDNTDGDGPLDYSELSISRRLHRGGEGQYLVNRTGVRRIDLVELLADLGLGGGMHSIIGQGKVEEVLSSSPERRREMIEEAAGLGRFKRQRHRAELKLQRVAIQAERARDVEAEVKKRLRPLALQATAAERAEKLVGEIASLRARIAQLDLDALGGRLAEGEERRTAAGLARRHVNERLESLLTQRNGVEEELTDAAGRREESTASLYRLRSAGERLTLRLESIAALRAGLPTAQETLTDGAELRRVAADAAAISSAAAKEREELSEALSLARTRLAALERTLAEREGLPPAARALAEEGERIALSQLDVAPGDERAVAAALRSRASAVLAPDAAAALALLERARAAGLGSLTVVTRVPEPVPRGAGRREGGPARADRACRHAGGLRLRPGERRAVVLGRGGRGCAARARGARPRASPRDRRARRVARARRCSRCRGSGDGGGGASRARHVAVGTGSIRSSPRASRAWRTARSRRSKVRSGRARDSRRRCAHGSTRARIARSSSASRCARSARRRSSSVARPLKRRSARAPWRSSSRGSRPTRPRRAAGSKRQTQCPPRATTATRSPNASTGSRSAGSRSVRSTRSRSRSTTPRRSGSRSSRRSAPTSRRASPSSRSCAPSSTKPCARRFSETYAAVEAHFHEVATTLFPGGEGRLRLVEPEDEEEQPGIEVELRPAGKRVTRLSLLSGGEKALGAISFLFALFLARPCPFYLLDEVEAALDDTNIGRFVELLRRYADRAQFIVITHQKRTMEAADTLYGVTMGPDGVSQIVSRRLPREDAVAVGAA